MIIGIDASRANELERTGVQNYAFHIIEYLIKIVPEHIQVVLYSREPMREPFNHLPKNWTSKVLQWRPKKLWTQIRLSWEMLMHSPDILFVPSHVFPIIHPKKTVMTVHDVGAMRFPQSYHWFERWYTLWSAGAALKRLWKIIVPSEFTRRELIKTLNHENIKAEEKIFVIQHGVCREFSNKSERDVLAALAKYGIRTPFILSVGRLEEKKNTVRLIKAFEFLKKNLPHRQASYPLLVTGYQLLLIGSPGHGYEKVREAIDESPFKSDIIELGHVDPDDLVYIMNAADVFVFPSLYEGFGLPVLEAMACGTPVIASRGNSCEEVGGSAAFYVNPENVEEIADGIHRVMSDASLHIDLVGKGFERAKSFSWEKCAEKTLDVLTEE